MMTEENIKEALSIRFIEAVSNYKGFKTSSSYPDYGTDLSIIEVGCRDENGHNTYFDTGRELKVQLKATTEKSVIIEQEIIKYDLEVKAYNDLINRKNNHKPLLLILFIMPLNKIKWITLNDNELILKKCAYWYYPGNSEYITDNTSQKRINISRNNLVTIDTVNQLFELYG